MDKNEIYFYKQNNIEVIKGMGLINLPCHTHNSYVIGKITGGRLHMSLKGQEYEMKAGMIFIVPSNVAISMTHEGVFSYRVFCFSNIAAAIMNLNEPKQLVFLDKSRYFDEILQMYQETKNEYKVIQEFLMWAFKARDNELKQKHQSEIVDQAIHYMCAHADEKLTVKEIADQFYISQFYFIRLFKQEMGITPKQYMIQNKLRLVKSMVFEQDRETDVAMDMEFAAQSHMCSLFKKYMGISISEYKKNCVNIGSDAQPYR